MVILLCLISTTAQGPINFAETRNAADGFQAFRRRIIEQDAPGAGAGFRLDDST
jgi:hypothetical protein